MGWSGHVHPRPAGDRCRTCSSLGRKGLRVFCDRNATAPLAGLCSPGAWASRCRPSALLWSAHTPPGCPVGGVCPFCTLRSSVTHTPQFGPTSGWETLDTGVLPRSRSGQGAPWLRSPLSARPQPSPALVGVGFHWQTLRCHTAAHSFPPACHPEGPSGSPWIAQMQSSWSAGSLGPSLVQGHPRECGSQVEPPLLRPARPAEPPSTACLGASSSYGF